MYFYILGLEGWQNCGTAERSWRRGVLDLASIQLLGLLVGTSLEGGPEVGFKASGGSAAGRLMVGELCFCCSAVSGCGGLGLVCHHFHGLEFPLNPLHSLHSLPGVRKAFIHFISDFRLIFVFQQFCHLLLNELLRFCRK